MKPIIPPGRYPLPAGLISEGSSLDDFLVLAASSPKVISSSVTVLNTNTHIYIFSPGFSFERQSHPLTNCLLLIPIWISNTSTRTSTNSILELSIHPLYPHLSRQELCSSSCSGQIACLHSLSYKPPPNTKSCLHHRTCELSVSPLQLSWLETPLLHTCITILTS